MAKEEKPIEYRRRILDTKGIAQRLDLEYLDKPNRFRDWRRRLMWIAPLAALIGVAPFVAGVGGSERAFSNGPVSRPHSVFESNCAACHAERFSSVSDASCQGCHDGPPHPAKALDAGVSARQIRCAQCHIEHLGQRPLAAVANRNCTVCHSNLKDNATNVRLAGARITRFADGRHPEFSPAGKNDMRPLRLNHAIHMPQEPKTIRGMKLPMKCSDCHTTDTASPTGDLLAVSFDRHCFSCHKRELEFDVYQVLGAQSEPAPHTRNAQAIHEFIAGKYAAALERDPSLPQRPLGRDFAPAGAAWLQKVVRDSELFLFERKCKYCHEYDGEAGGFPKVKKVTPILGQYAPDRDSGSPWLLRGEFSHRSHRAVDCESCHAAARASAATADVLIPRMRDCLICHGSSGTHLDNCAQCHLYHNKSKELDRDRRPADHLLRGAAHPLSPGIAQFGGVQSLWR
jgi:hypothetical protein